ncbi:MAG: L-threonylcarbamoyladenylate synthase [Oceanicoccus sp.]|jgi:L-threonylcarbamoyladenylate synthase
MQIMAGRPIIRERLAIKLAVDTLRVGGVIAYPTEAVWGLGCDPHNETALLRLLSIKARSRSKGLILVASSINQFAPYLEDVDVFAMNKLRATWPGPTTWVVTHNGFAHDLVRGNHNTVALRVSAHPVVARLCASFGGPIVSTSANISGSPPPLWSWQLRRRMGKYLDYIVSGSLGASKKPTEIRDLRSDEVLRSAS